MRAAVPPSASDPSPDDGSSGLVFQFAFTADGAPAADSSDAVWTWKNYSLTDARARRAIEQDLALPEPVRLSLLSNSTACHIDFDDGWVFGETPDLRHEHYSEARELGHFRFAFNGSLLISGRRHPLRSVEAIKRAVASGRRVRSPAALIESVVSQSLDHLAVEIAALSDTLDIIEDRIVGDVWHGEREALTQARRLAVIVHRQVATVTQLFRHLDQKHDADLPEETADLAARLSHRATVLHHDCEQIQARARLLQDELLAKLTAQSNRLLYFLSLLTAVLMPMTIISGLFGMNVGGVPFASGQAGFWIVSGLAIVTAALVFVLVTRLGRAA